MQLSIHDGFGGSKVERAGNSLPWHGAAEEGSNKVYVWWPRRGSRGKWWEGELVDEPSSKGK